MKNKKHHFREIHPSNLYVGTPVALITTVDENDHANIGPISSAWALGWSFMLGLLCTSKTFKNLIAQKQCVVNFPSADLYERVEKIAGLTGLHPVPEYKKDRYKYEEVKFEVGRFSKILSNLVSPPRIAECAIQLETELKEVVYITDDPIADLPLAAISIRVLRVHAHENIIVKENHIDPTKWNPLIYNFRHYQGLEPDLGKTFKAEI